MERKKFPASEGRVILVGLAVFIGLSIVSTVLSAYASILSEPLEWQIDNPLGPQTTYIGTEVQDGFGSDLSSGDINGDGHEDLVIGARFVSGITQAAGEVYVLLGPGNFDQTHKMPEGAALTLQGMPGYQPQLGTYVDTGDVNGDGFDDILTGGVPYSRSILYLGSPLITSTVPQTVIADPKEVAITILYREDPEGQITCDINGDGYADLILETYDKVWGVLGHPGITMTMPATIELGVDPVDLQIIGFETDQGSFPGTGNLGCGDFDGDGISDLIVGSEFESPGGRAQAGAVFIFRGTEALTSTQPITWHAYLNADAIIEGLDGPHSVTLGDMLGARIEIADVNADGRHDLILGAVGGDGLNNWYLDSGEVYLVLGRELNGQAIDLAVDAQWMAYLNQGSLYLGYSIGAGDFDRDGRAEVIVGCGGCNQLDTGRTAGGVAFIVDADQMHGTIELSQSSSLAIYSSASGTSLGANVGSIDLDEDGFDDPLIVNTVQWEGPDSMILLSYPIRNRIFFPSIIR